MVLPILFVCLLIISTIIVDEYITKYIFDTDKDYNPDKTISKEVSYTTENNETIIFLIDLNNTIGILNQNGYNDNESFYKAERLYFAE